MDKSERPSLFSLVTITGKDVPVREFLINYSHHDTKVWLTKTLIWGLMNERQINVARATARDIETKQLFTPRPFEPELVSQ